MAKRRYSNSRKRKSRRGKKSRHTKHHDGRRHHHTRRRVRRGGSVSVCQNGGVQQPTGSCMNVTSAGGQMKVFNPAGGRA